MHPETGDVGTGSPEAPPPVEAAGLLPGMTMQIADLLRKNQNLLSIAK
jgi:hypothetical protein